MLMSEHVYCVAVAFKMIERVEQRICIKLCIKLEHSSVETTGIIPKAIAMGSWWLAASSQQHAHSCITSCAELFGETSLSPATAQIWHPATSGFSQNQNDLWKGRDFRPLMRFRKIWWGSWWRLGELCKAPRCLLWRGLRHHFPMYNVSCILYLLQLRLHFSY